jgi:hypothetical protein
MDKRTTANRQTRWTADELLRAEFPEPKWTVPGLVPEGATLLAGPPKVGKSWLMTGMALAVASGGQALGQVQVEAGPVLYLALEDTPRRFQGRTRLLLGDGSAPRDLTVWTKCERWDQGGQEALHGWLKEHPDTRLVVVDVFARMRTPAQNGSAYEADYEAMSGIQKLAGRFGTAIVVAHHTRKAASEDFVETVSGTNGLAGAADTLLVLRRSRGQADATLHVTGRDVEEFSYALRKGAAFGTWELLDGPALDYALGGTRLTILRHVRQRPAMPLEIAKATGLDHALVRQTCKRMERDGQIRKDGLGRYMADTPVTPVTRVTDPVAVSLPSPMSLSRDTRIRSDSSERSDSPTRPRRRLKRIS